MSYSQEWLEDPSAIRAVFIEATYYDVINAVDKQVYISNAGYNTTDGITSFDPIVMGGVSLSESMSTDGGLSFSFGDINIYNNNGEYDDWLDPTKYIWVNRSINVYLGDPLWTTTSIATLKTEFLQIFSGLISDIDSKNRNSLTFKVRDKMEKLNTPITEVKFPSYGVWPGGQPNLDKIIPIVFGEVFNMEPELINPATLEYRFNRDASQDLLEIRDNGVPIYSVAAMPSGELLGGATVDLVNSTFVLTHPPAGTITCSVQGIKKSLNLTTGASTTNYTNRAVNMISVIATQYGKAGSPPLTVGELDLSNLETMDALATSMCGTLISDRSNLLEVCTGLADSYGMQLYLDRTGKLKILRINNPLGSSTSINETDIIYGTLAISKRCDVIASAKIGYCKNWTVQSDLLTGIPIEHKKNFATEWYSKTSVNGTVQSRYKLFADPEQKDTTHQTGSAATTEADRIVGYWSTPRTIYKFTGIARLLSLQLGQPVTLTHSRYGLSAGRSGQVYSLTPNWLDSTIEVEVII